MDCAQVQELISSYNDRELPPDEMRLVEEHLGTCPECANASGMVANLSRLAKEWRGVEGSTSFHRRVMDASAKAPAARRVTGAVLAGAAFLILVAAAAVFGLGPFGGAGDERDAETSAANCPRVQGRAWVLPPGESATWTPLAPGAALAPLSRVRLERGASAEFEIGGGADVALREMTEAEVKDSGLRFMEGKGAVAVKTFSTSSKDFILTGPGFEVAVAPGSVAFVRPGAGGILHVSVLKGRAIMGREIVGGAHQVEAGTNLKRTILGEIEASPLTDETVFEPFRE